MSKRYLATIMDRHYLGDESFIFSCNYATVGEIDEETGLFVDRNGNEYANMISPTLLGSEINQAYSNVIEMDNIKKVFGDAMSIRDSIKEYEFQCRKVLFYVGKTSDGYPFAVSLNRDDLKSIAEGDMPGQQEQNENELSEELNQLIKDTINGQYSLDELKQIRDSLKLTYDDIESAFDTISLQIEAAEKGESFVNLVQDAEPVDKEHLVKKDDSIEKVEVFKPKIDIEDLFKKVTKTLIAQDEPARRVITEIARKEMDSRKKREGILLTGSTGVGKTELMRLIAKYLNKPFHTVDSTQLTVPGFTGKDIEEVLWELYIKCGKDKEKTEQAIIFFDEIDKKGSPKKDDHSGQGVLNLLLPFIEGTKYDACFDMKTALEKVKIDTSNMTVIFGGAYTDVYKNLLQKNGIGFNSRVETKDIYKKATTKDFVERGMMTDEFMGRVVVVKLNDLDVNDIKRVMLESDESAIKIQQDIFDKLGVKLTFTDGFTTAIAKNAEEKKTGARGLNGIIDESTWEAFAEVYIHQGEYEEVILDEETVKDPSHYQLVKKENKQINK